MNKEIVEIDKEKGVCRVTTIDERWYIKEIKDSKTGLPSHAYIPSVTWICGSYPKGVGYYKWLAAKGWDEAEDIKTAAGEKGSKVHLALTDLIKGKEIKIDDKYLNKNSGQAEELTLEEYDCILSFANWEQETKPKFIFWDIYCEGEGHAGMIDLICEIDKVKWLIDFKTSQYVWPSHELQVSAYKHSKHEDCNLAILQVGYKANKKHWKFTEITDQYDLFLAAKKIWAKENEGVEPKQRDYPLSIKLSQGEK